MPREPRSQDADEAIEVVEPRVAVSHLRSGLSTFRAFRMIKIAGK
jgi:hypothetical protein